MIRDWTLRAWIEGFVCGAVAVAMGVAVALMRKG